MKRTLSALLAGLAQIPPEHDRPISGLALDSRTLRSGEVFVALRGAQTHGLAHVEQARARGASAVLWEPPYQNTDVRLAETDLIRIDALSEKLSALAGHWFDEPSHALDVIGVTGTNGKTSSVQFLVQAASSLGVASGSIGTLGAGMHGALVAGERTTPDAISVQSLLSDMHTQGAQRVAMEVSSHALVLGRVNAVRFRSALFTNLTRDHLDFHGDMAAYAAAKARLFRWPELGAAIINADDTFGRALLEESPLGENAHGYGFDASHRPALLGRNLRLHARGMAFDIDGRWGRGSVECALVGSFNAQNVLGVIGVLLELGHPLDSVIQAVSNLSPVPGRMNAIGGDGHPLVVIDYAHTPDALAQALAAVRAHAEGRVICVFGCGGDRDRGKRAPMGEVAERLADQLIVTDDNPRGEDGALIVAGILQGLGRPDAAWVERDRARAIRRAIQTARKGDVVLIAGKGHEPYQEIAGRRIEFNDLTQAQTALAELAC